jgi:hypothetical protein
MRCFFLPFSVCFLCVFLLGGVSFCVRFLLSFFFLTLKEEG